MGGLSAFYAKNVKPANATVSFVVSDRFVERDENGEEKKDKKGNTIPAKFTIRAIKPSKFMRIASGSVSIAGGEPSLSGDGMANAPFAMIVEALVEPDLHDKDLQDSYGVLTPYELIDEMFTSSEVQTLLTHINTMQAGEGSFQDKVDELKNS